MVDFIAEVSSNHNQDLDRCLRFVDMAAEIGCWGIKFQLFRVDGLFAPEVTWSWSVMPRRDWELPLRFLSPIAERCRERGVKFICTPFYLEAVDELESYVDIYKIGSYELLWNDLLRKCAATGKPMILSTGMATLQEVTDAAIECLLETDYNTDLRLLHCVSAYPAPRDQCNLKAIDTLRQVQLCVGWSDHSHDPAVLYRAAFRWGAEIIEFHLDLDGEGGEAWMGHCWLPNEIAPIIKGINAWREMDGDGDKRPMAVETDRPWRADPSDGLRPLLATRETLSKNAG